MKDEAGRQRLVSAIEEYLQEWEAGYDWRWTAGRPQSWVDIDALVSQPDDPDIKALAAVHTFLEQFEFCRDHSDPTLCGISWDDVPGVMRETLECLKNDLPITNPAILRFVYNPRVRRGCSPAAWWRGVFRTKG